jgi:hypothetical protein
MDERDEQKLAQEAKRKRKLNRRYIALGVFALVFIAVNIVLCLKTPVEEERFIPSKQPVATTIILNQAVQDYAKDHEGKVPGTLNELAEKYIPSGDLPAANLEKFHYVKTSPSSYELGVGKFGDESDSDLIFTEDGLK